MLTINFEFRKGIFFIRLIGDLNKKSDELQEKNILNLINQNKFKYIVLNINYLKTIDLSGINYITQMYYVIKENKSNLILCDYSDIFKTLFNKNIPSIANEIEVL